MRSKKVAFTPFDRLRTGFDTLVAFDQPLAGWRRRRRVNLRVNAFKQS